MQDQLSPAQTNLQQPRNDLQQGSSSLQQVSNGQQSNTTNPNQLPPASSLRVETIAQPQPGQRVESAAQANTDSGLFLLLLLLPLIVTVVVLWPRRKVVPAHESFAPEASPETVPAPVPSKKTKSKKKTTKRKKSSKR